MLGILGEAKKSEDKVPPIAIKVAEIYTATLKLGLKKVFKENLKKYKTPENCEMLKLSAIKPEHKNDVSRLIIEKDSYQILLQSQLEISLSALAKTLTTMLENKKIATVSMGKSRQSLGD